MTKLISFFDQVTGLVDEGESAAIAYLGYSKVPDCLTQHSPEEVSSPVFGHVYSSLGEKKKLARQPDAENGGEWS